jgi:hypothetical protein
MLAAAAHSALAALRARKLITLVANSLDKPTHWKLTPLGRAVVASALDPGTGVAQKQGCERGGVGWGQHALMGVGVV